MTGDQSSNLNQITTKRLRVLSRFVFLLVIFGLISFFYDQGSNSKGGPSSNQANQEWERQPENPKDQVLFIPKLQAWVPIVYLDSEDELQIQLGLAKGVVHMPNTAKPGEVGNAFILGHARSYAWLPSSYSSVFARLEELQAGDVIAVIDQTGQMEFVVANIIITRLADFTVMTQETNGRRLISLQAYYPKGVAEQRYIVLAELSR